MQGRIIHYNDAEGKGLIATPLRQWLFHISQWRSDVAPAPNHRVRLLVQDGHLLGVEKISPLDLLLPLAGTCLARLGLPLLAAHAAFLASLIWAFASAGFACTYAYPDSTSHLPMALVASTAPLLPLLLPQKRWAWTAMLLPLAYLLVCWSATPGFPVLRCPGTWPGGLSALVLAVLGLRRLSVPAPRAP